MRRANVNVYPAGGFYFIENDGTTIRANNSWASVAARVVAYRRRNKLPPGDPTTEVNAQACARNPNVCHEDADPEYNMALKKASLKGRVLGWAATLRARQPLSFVDEATMRARARVCSRCVAHAAIAGGCGSCRRAVKEVRSELLGGRPIDDRVAGCTALGEDCGINTWLADPTVLDDTLPGCCWRRRSPP